MLHFNAPLGCSPHISRYFTKIYYWEGTTLNLISVKVIISRVTRRLCSASWAAFNFFWLSGFFQLWVLFQFKNGQSWWNIHRQTRSEQTPFIWIWVKVSIYFLPVCVSWRYYMMLYFKTWRQNKTVLESSWWKPVLVFVLDSDRQKTTGRISN